MFGPLRWNFYTVRVNARASLWVQCLNDLGPGKPTLNEHVLKQARTGGMSIYLDVQGSFHFITYLVTYSVFTITQGNFRYGAYLWVSAAMIQWVTTTQDLKNTCPSG